MNPDYSFLTNWAQCDAAKADVEFELKTFSYRDTGLEITDERASRSQASGVAALAKKDGEILTACQQACPTNAITFGDLNDPQSEVIKLKAEPHNYGLLAELNTMPRTSYLAAIRNPNKNMPQGA